MTASSSPLGNAVRILRIPLVLALAVVTAWALFVFRPGPAREKRPETRLLVAVETLRPTTAQMKIEAYGTIRPGQPLKLIAEIPGRIVALHPQFIEGGDVQAGDVLIRIDERALSLESERRTLQVRQAETEEKRIAREIVNLKSSREITQADVSLAEAEFKRLKQLGPKKVIAQSSLDQAEQRLLASRGRLQQIDNQLAITRLLAEQAELQTRMSRIMKRQGMLDLEKCTITSPFKGRVLEKAVEKDQLVSPGTYLGSVYKTGEFEIEVQLSPEDLDWLPTPISPQTIRAELVLDKADPALILPAVVSRLAARMDAATRTQPVILTATDTDATPSSRLLPGTFVLVRILGKTIDNTFILPRHLVHDHNAVYIAENNRLKIKTVHIYRFFKDQVYIDRGLAAGDLVITTPVSSAFDGMALDIGQPS